MIPSPTRPDPYAAAENLIDHFALSIEDGKPLLVPGDCLTECHPILSEILSKARAWDRFVQDVRPALPSPN